MPDAEDKAQSRAAPPRALCRLLRRFRGDGRGVAAVEFAMIAVPFFGLLFAIFETAFVFMAYQGLDAATVAAARELMTGQAQNVAAIKTADQFRDSLICNPTPPAQRILPSYIDCSKLIVDVSQASDFANADVSGSFYTNPTTNYDPGGANCVVVVRVIYPMPVYMSIIAFNGVGGIGDVTAGQTLYNGSMRYMLMSTSVFRNEPFPSTPYSAC